LGFQLTSREKLNLRLDDVFHISFNWGVVGVTEDHLNLRTHFRVLVDHFPVQMLDFSASWPISHHNAADYVKRGLIFAEKGSQVRYWDYANAIKSRNNVLVAQCQE